eukprot:5082354-Pyramimonas_sp.AAC.1
MATTLLPLEPRSPSPSSSPWLARSPPPSCPRRSRNRSCPGPPAGAARRRPGPAFGRGPTANPTPTPHDF